MDHFSLIFKILDLLTFYLKIIYQLKISIEIICHFILYFLNYY